LVSATDERRDDLVARLRRCQVPEELLAWLTSPGMNPDPGAGAAVPWWNGVLAALGPDAEPLDDEVFDVAIHAYLDDWVAEEERVDLFRAASELGRAARALLSTRSS
jgi:hypothetical protein